MNAKILYDKFIYNSKRDITNEEVVRLCRNILDSDESMQVKSATLSVYTYKSIELNCDSHEYLDLYSTLLQELELAYLKDEDGGYRSKNVRNDEFQLFLSLVTSRWHWLLHSSATTENIVAVLDSDVRKIINHNLFKASYSLNVFKSILFLSAIYFVTGERDKQISLAEHSISVYKKIVASMGGENFPISNHFADLASANNALEVILSGKEWVSGENYRPHRWNPSRIMHACSRVSINNCSHFKDIALDFFDPKFFEKKGKIEC